MKRIRRRRYVQSSSTTGDDSDKLDESSLRFDQACEILLTILSTDYSGPRALIDTQRTAAVSGLRSVGITFAAPGPTDGRTGFPVLKA